MRAIEKNYIRSLVICRCLFSYLQYAVVPSDSEIDDLFQVFLAVRYQMGPDFRSMLLYMLVTCAKTIVTIVILANVLHEAFQPGKYGYLLRCGVGKLYAGKLIEISGMLVAMEAIECVLLVVLFQMHHTELVLVWEQVLPFLCCESILVMAMLCLIMMAEILLCYMSLSQFCITVALGVCVVGYGACLWHDSYPWKAVFLICNYELRMTWRKELLAAVCVAGGLACAGGIAFKKREDYV